MEAKLEQMSLNLASSPRSKQPKSSKSNPKSKEIVESWEEDDDDSSSDHESSSTQTGTAHHGRSSLTGARLSIPNAPPPTPISPTGFKDWPSGSTNSSRPTSSDKRPEKTTATASRMIAGALGVRAPPKTEEQRAYERAVKEGEIRRREREKAEKRREAEEEERAKSSVWDG